MPPRGRQAGGWQLSGARALPLRSQHGAGIALLADGSRQDCNAWLRLLLRPAVPGHKLLLKASRMRASR